MIVGSSAAWADEVFYTLDGSITGGTNGYATESEITQNSMTWMVTGNTTMNPWRIGGKNLTDENRPVYSTTAMATAISKVDLTVGTANLTVNSIKLIVASDADFSNKLDEISADFKASSTISFAPTTGSEWATGSYYKFIFNVTAGSSNQYVQLSKAEFYYKPSTPANKLESISLSGTYSTTFTEGDEFNHSGMIVTATYDDSSTKDVSSAATFSGYDMSTTGSQEVTVSYTEGEVTKTATYDITVNAIPTHKVTWSVNGSTTQETYKEGASITFPANPGDIDDKKFMGWVSTAISGTTNDAPTFVTSATMGTEDVTYYAVFATVSGTLSEKIDVLDNAFTGVGAVSNYSSWENKKGTSGATYAGNSAGDKETIQLRTTNSNSGVITTTSGGTVKSFTITWDPSYNGRVLNVYGKKTAYSSPTDLYNSNKQGTLLGSFTYDETKGSYEASLDIVDDYEYIGFRSNSGALYLKTVKITWETGSAVITDYCTTVAADTRADAELSFSVSELNVNVGENFNVPILNKAAGFNGTVEYSSSNESVAQVDTETGELRIIAEGTTTITASFAGNDDFKPGSASYTLTVTDNRIATTITQDNIVLDIADVNTLTQLAPVVKDANNNVVAYDNSGQLPEVYFNLDNDENGIIGSLGSNGEIILNSVVGTATITATYNHFNENTYNKPSSCTFTITVESTMTIAEVREQATGNVTTKGVVTSCAGTTAYIQDATAAICVYGQSLTVGDEVKVSGTLTTYNGLLEITSPTTTVLSSGNTVTPDVMTIADINISDKQGWLVKIENATVTAISSKNVTIEQGGESIVVRFNDTNDITFAVNYVITLTGNIGCYNNAQIANPTDITVAADTTPSVTVSETEINVDAAEHEGTITVTYANISDINADVVFCDATGAAAPAEPTWITADINSENNNIDYLIEANTGEARTAYMKVYALDDDANDVYSELITITQAAAAVTPQPTGSYYVKVTNNNELTSGQYLIVCDEIGVAFDGSLATLDASSNTINVESDESIIEATNETTAAEFTITMDGGKGSIKSASGLYIGQTTDANGLKTNATATDDFMNIIKLAEDSEGDAVIHSAGGAYLRYNATSGQDRFRYYKSASYTSQKPIQLYKAVDTPTSVPVTLAASGYASYCSAWPLDLTPTEDYAAWYVSAVEGANVTFSKIEGTVPANTPFILYNTAKAGKTVKLPIVAATTAPTALSGNHLKGTLVNTTVSTVEGEYTNFGLSGGSFVKMNNGTVKAHKAYLPILTSAVPSDARLNIVFEDDNTTTGIQTMNNVHRTMDNVYNLNGQRVNNAKKGLYIVNGKKVVIK